jgi:hypothetical protein
MDAPDKTSVSNEESGEISALTPSMKKKLLTAFFWLAVLISVVTAVSFLQMNINVLDEGFTTMHAWRISRGEIIYKDFFALHTPLSFLILGNLYKIFGATFLTGRVFALIVALLYMTFGILLVEKIVKNRLYSTFLAALLCQAGFSGWPYPSHHTLAALFALSAMYFFISLKNNTGYFLFGGFAALTFWTLQDEGFYLITASFILMFLLRENRKTFLSFAAGGIVFSLPMIFYVLLYVPFAKIFEDVFKYPLGVYHVNPEAHFYIYQLFLIPLQMWQNGQYANAPLYAVSITITSLFLVCEPLIALLACIIMIKNRMGEKRILLGLTVLYIVYMATAFHHLTYINLMFGIAAPNLLVIYFLQIYGQKKEGFRRATNYIIIFLTICFLFVGLNLVHSVHGQGSLPEVKTRSGTVYVLWPDLAKCVQEVVDEIEKTVPENGYVLTREMPLLNFLTKRASPIPIDYFQPPFNPPEERTKRLIEDIRGMDNIWIVTQRIDYSPSVFDSYLNENYEPLGFNDALVLWKKKSPVTKDGQPAEIPKEPK